MGKAKIGRMGRRAKKQKPKMQILSDVPLGKSFTAPPACRGHRRLRASHSKQLNEMARRFAKRNGLSAEELRLLLEKKVLVGIRQNNKIAIGVSKANMGELPEALRERVLAGLRGNRL
jgi:hypothetical protein